MAEDGIGAPIVPGPPEPQKNIPTGGEGETEEQGTAGRQRGVDTGPGRSGRLFLVVVGAAQIGADGPGAPSQITAHDGDHRA